MSPPQHRTGPRQPAGAERPKVVYVMGAGRSGSTILGVALGNCTDVFYAGELHLWVGKAGRSPLPGAERARFWSAVADEVGASPGMSADEVRSLEQSSAALRLKPRRAARRLRGRYRRTAEDLYRAVARVAGVTHVVDTSHFPRRARELQALGGIDLYLLFVVRDPRRVAASYSGDDKDFPRFNLLTTNIYLWLTYLLSLPVFLRHPRRRRLLVRYEAFISNPEGVLRDILDFVESPAAIPDLGALRTGAAFQGNAILRSGVVALERQSEQPPPRGSWLTGLLSLPWTLVFALLRPAARAPAMGAGDPPVVRGT